MQSEGTSEGTTEQTAAASRTPAPSASVTVDQGDVLLCRTHDDIARESAFPGRDGVGLSVLQVYVEDWMDDLEAAERQARNKALRAAVSEVIYELSKLNVYLTIAQDSDDDTNDDLDEAIRAVTDASRTASSMCRLQVGGGDYRSAILELATGVS